MGKIVVTEFISLDGVIEDPGGAEDIEYGGWSFRHPGEDGDQFKIDELNDADAAAGPGDLRGIRGGVAGRGGGRGRVRREDQRMPKFVVSTTITDRAGTTRT